MLQAPGTGHCGSTEYLALKGLKYSGQEFELFIQFAVYVSNTTVTLKQGQDHQTYNDNVDPKQGYNHVKFKRSRCNDVQEKANVKGGFFQMRKHMSIISLEYVWGKERGKRVLYS